MMRCFVSVGLSEKARQSLAGFQKEAYERLSLFAKLKQVEEQNLHLTLAFIGELSEPEAEKAKKALGSIKLEKFPIIISRLGFFGSTHSPRVIYLSVPSKELSELSAAVAGALKTAKLAIKTRAVKPHLTLFRIKQAFNPGALIKEIKALSELPLNLEQEVGSFELMSSKLTQSGPVYQKIASFILL
ncbi:MAG TPA: RNA 2',3'-cyclic phosphodiesterase [Candidatus Woesearchaeota archaeon]|nr:RNA 2',3'-cyclic phosphodiesterase [Candidatus Woesearchaeota archaeon]